MRLLDTPVAANESGLAVGSKLLPMPCSQTLAAGDSIIFALAYSHPGQESGYEGG